MRASTEYVVIGGVAAQSHGPTGLLALTVGMCVKNSEGRDGVREDPARAWSAILPWLDRRALGLIPGGQANESELRRAGRAVLLTAPSPGAPPHLWDPPREEASRQFPCAAWLLSAAPCRVEDVSKAGA